MAKVTKFKTPESARHTFHRYLVSLESGGTEWRAFCPLCEDPADSKSPSASFNFDKMVWDCKGKCGAGGSIGRLASQLKEDKGFDINKERMTGRNADKGSPLVTLNANRSKGVKVTAEQVKSWQRKLFAAPTLLSQLMNERGFTEETVRKFCIGWNGSRYTIPVYDEDGEVINVRKYNLNATKSSDKMLNVPGCSVSLFGVDVLKANDEIMLVEGETDMMLTNQYGVPAVTHTAGAATFKGEWAPHFKDKRVYICYDNDDAGRKGAIKAARMIAGYADSVYTIEIPLPDKGADLTDFLFREGRTKSDLDELKANAKPSNATRAQIAEESPRDGKSVELEASMSQEHQKEPLEIMVTIAGKRNPPYRAPRRFAANCGLNQGKKCDTCPLMFNDGEMTAEIGPHDPDLLRFVDVNEDKYNKNLREVIQANCTMVEYNVLEQWNLEELTVGNSVDDRAATEDQRPVTREVYSVGTHSTPVNTVARIVGANGVNAKNSRMTFQAWEIEQVQTSLDKFELTDEMRNELLSFQLQLRDGTETPLDKCFEIAKHNSQHATKIYDRDILHVAYDLVWHSPLSFEVEGKLIDKGWLEMMVVGDTRTGKSETAIQLSKYYGSGVIKSCEGATFAGLVGGVQQTSSGSWMTTWGVIPLNDRRLVVLDEVSGLKDRDVIENMSSIRSSGRAQITKISNEETSARTRLIWVTNPGDGAMIDERPDVGVGALRSVVKNQEDIARFDFVMAARASEVDSSVINSDHSSGRVRYTPEMCQALVLWAWSLRPEQIVFTDNAVERARKISSGIGDEYVADPPLIQTENFRFKLYRVAAAIAARTFSIDWPEKGRYVLQVESDHVDAAMAFFNMIYDSPGMEYKSASEEVISSQKRARQMRAGAKEYIIMNSTTVLATLRAVSKDSRFRNRDFEEFGGMTKDASANAVQQLQNMGMIRRANAGYIVMTKELVSLLRELSREDY